jgi:hypothetical protein
MQYEEQQPAISLSFISYQYGTVSQKKSISVEKMDFLYNFLCKYTKWLNGQGTSKKFLGKRILFTLLNNL